MPMLKNELQMRSAQHQYVVPRTYSVVQTFYENLSYYRLLRTGRALKQKLGLLAHQACRCVIDTMTWMRECAYFCLHQRR